MANKRVKTSQFSDSIADILADFARDMGTSLEDAKKEQVVRGRSLLRDNSPKLTGDYSKGWRYRKDGKTGYRIYNATDWQLTHLLEDGHAKVGGGRVEAKPHIEPVAELISDEFVSSFIRKIRTW